MLNLHLAPGGSSLKSFAVMIVKGVGYRIAEENCIVIGNLLPFWRMCLQLL